LSHPIRFAWGSLPVLGFIPTPDRCVADRANNGLTAAMNMDVLHFYAATPTVSNSQPA
jgi:hypothetical protein